MRKNRKIFCIITAAGSGERFGKGSSVKVPKQFINLCGKPVIIHSLEVFQKCTYITEILVSSNPAYFDLIHTLAIKYRITKLKAVVEGGKTRFESVRNAFRQIESTDNDIVIIHDAARPNISKSFVRRIIEDSLKYGEVIPGCRVRETIKRVYKSGFVKETIDRSELFIVQTPQAFRYEKLAKAYSKCRSAKKTDFTDEAQAIEFAGFKIKMIEGLRDNVKITIPEDVTLLKKLMK
ncbi:MAG: 2-C-methyl-D-erythritol 4-phosphate cytidylyltransferase [Ignavibacteria bacterium]|nr:2-C-methyl-D-erythritol 4-phosphate cytidylyltransferase [Ignavibacteria bacterium]